MARAETIESAGETGIGRNGLFSQHSTCCLELARPLQTGPGRLSTAPITYSSGTDTSPMHRHHNGHSLQSLQAVCVSNPFMYLHPEDQDQPSSYQQLPSSSSAPFPLPLHYRGGNDEGFAGEQSGKNSTLPTNITMLHAFCVPVGPFLKFRRALNLPLLII